MTTRPLRPPVVRPVPAPSPTRRVSVRTSGGGVDGGANAAGRVDGAGPGGVDAAMEAVAAGMALLAEGGSTPWHGRDRRELMDALRRLEAVTRQAHAVASVVTAELVTQEQHAGRTEASAARHAATRLRVPDATVRDRVAAGRRCTEPGMTAMRAGRITAAQERCLARALRELDGHDEVPAAARAALAEHLVTRAAEGTPTTVLTREAESALCRLLPGRQDEREAAQARRREAVTHTVQTDGTSLLSIVCTPELRALVDTIAARYARRGRCLPPVVDPATGLPADPADPRTLDQLAAEDERSYAQRVHDALWHVLEVGLAADNSTTATRAGVASIVIRMTPEQAEAVFAGEHGGQVVTDAGSAMSARQAAQLVGRGSWFLSALHRGRELLTRLPIDGILERPPEGPGPGPERSPKPPGPTPPPTTELGSTARGPYRGRHDPRGPRLAGPLQRLVLHAAHGGCTHPDCHTPAARCQAHHLLEYRDGGRTVLVNLCLVCPIHHGWIGTTAGSWRTEPDPAAPGRPRWIPPAADPLGEAA